MLKKLFGGLKLTWPRVIAFAVLAGVYTGLAAAFVPETCSFHDIAVTFEVWIVLAIIIITSCQTPLEAAAKTFVFFLISQPLVYLVQVPFSWQGWGLFRYYGYWFVVTLLTFPGAFVGWFIKKGGVISGAILSVMTALLVYQGARFAQSALSSFPNHLLSAVFCFAAAILLIFGVLRDRPARLTAAVLTAAALAAVLILGRAGPPPTVYTSTAELAFDREACPFDGTWTAELENKSLGEVRIVELPGEEPMLAVTVANPGETGLILTSPDGEAHRLELSCDETGRVTVRE